MCVFCVFKGKIEKAGLAGRKRGRVEGGERRRNRMIEKERKIKKERKGKRERERDRVRMSE